MGKGWGITISKSVLGRKSSYSLTKAKPVKPKLKLGVTEREVLWTLLSLRRDIKRTELTSLTGKDLRKTLIRLKNKGLVKESKEHYIELTKEGKGVVLYFSKRGSVWGKRHVPKLQTQYKLVAFDLDDTLIPGYVNKFVDVETMRRFLHILKANNIKIAVLSINTPETVYYRLRDYGLLRYIDYPIFTQKGTAIQTLKHVMNLKDNQILFIGHDISMDYHNVKSLNPKVKVALLRDALSSGDAGTYSKPYSPVLIDRSIPTFIKVLENKIPIQVEPIGVSIPITTIPTVPTTPTFDLTTFLEPKQPSKRRKKKLRKRITNILKISHEPLITFQISNALKGVSLTEAYQTLGELEKQGTVKWRRKPQGWVSVKKRR